MPDAITLAWLLPALPLAGFTVLALVGRRLPRRAVAAVGVGSVALSFGVFVAILVRWLLAPRPGDAYTQVLWRWIEVAGFTSDIALYLDPLALVMTGVVTGVGALIHLYSAEYMEADEGYARFFASMNLFVASMLLLVLADDLLLLYLGWEGVGLCSYLLIGFWYRDPANGRAARKAFVVTRIGDAAMAVGLFLIFRELGTLEIQEAMTRAQAAWAPGAGLATIIAALLLGGAVGKSAQIPLQTWLPDAMAGPTPVSALIHAATMVTAGVYLIARLHGLFSLAPAVLTAVAFVGAATLLIAGFSALTQRDIKRVLAYSTISQIGYMFLALGVGAWSAAIFHLVTHAFFKALLFLGAGAIMLAAHHETDLFRMGGLRRALPVTFVTTVIGAAALAGFPVLTAGFFSKDLILWQAWASPLGGPWLWAVGITGAFVTTLYAFRLVFLAFFGPPRTPVEHRPGLRVRGPLVVLALLSIVGGWVEVPPTLGARPSLSEFLAASVPVVGAEEHPVTGELILQGVAAVVVLTGIALAWLAWRRGAWGDVDRARTPLAPAAVHRLWDAGWGFDRVYETFVVRPFVLLARLNAGDVLDGLQRGLAAVVAAGSRAFLRTQTGRLRHYAAGVAAGTIALVALGVLL